MERTCERVWMQDNEREEKDMRWKRGEVQREHKLKQLILNVGQPPSTGGHTSWNQSPTFLGLQLTWQHIISWHACLFVQRRGSWSGHALWNGLVFFQQPISHQSFLYFFVMSENGSFRTIIYRTCGKSCPFLYFWVVIVSSRCCYILSGLKAGYSKVHGVKLPCPSIPASLMTSQSEHDPPPGHMRRVNTADGEIDNGCVWTSLPLLYILTIRHPGNLHTHAGGMDVFFFWGGVMLQLLYVSAQQWGRGW